MSDMVILRQCAFECDTYGSSVVAAFGEYCGHRARILRRRPHWVSRAEAVSDIIVWLMRPETWRSA